jgi:lambda repressor-like predicted transcriptional regulator
MEVFISWSGPRSKYVAENLRTWLPQVIQVLRPWMSDEDIHAGARWNSEIAGHLETASFGLICLTPENLKEPWILFEAGALAKTIEAALVIPYLIELEPAQISGPLSQFQAKRAIAADTFFVLRSLNAMLARSSETGGLSDQSLEQTFKKWWPELERTLATLPEVTSDATPNRTSEEKLDELLEITRQLGRTLNTPTPLREVSGLRHFIRGRRAALAGFMEQGALIELKGQSLEVVPRNDIYVKYLNDNRNSLAALASEYFNQRIEVKVTEPLVSRHTPASD